MWPRNDGLGNWANPDLPRCELDNRGMIPIDFGLAPPLYGPESIRRFQKEMWRDGKGTGCISYYTLFDV